MFLVLTTCSLPPGRNPRDWVDHLRYPNINRPPEITSASDSRSRPEASCTQGILFLLRSSRLVRHTARYKTVKGWRIPQMDYLCVLCGYFPAANFRKRPKGDVRRNTIPRTPVNKGKREGRGCSRPRPRKYLPLVGTHPSLAAIHSPKLPNCLLNCSCWPVSFSPLTSAR